MIYPTLNMIVRVEKSGAHKGNIIGVFADEQHFQHPNIFNLDMIDKRDGWTHCQVDWYRTKTRPATPEEEATFCEWYEPKHGHANLVKRLAPKKN